MLLFIPGNPGLAHFYTGWLSSIQSHLPSTTVYALGHLGHSPSSAAFAWTPKGAASLQDQVEHKVAFIDELSQTHDFGPGKDQTKLILLGHSIGCWIACEALKLRPALITSLHHFFPTLSHMAATPNGARLSPLFRPALFPSLSLTTAALSFLPAALLSPLVGFLTRQSSPSASVTTALVQSPGTVLAALSMAGEEMTRVKALDEDVLREFGGRMWWYWAKGEEDGWVRDSSVTEIVECLEKAGYGAERRWRCEEGMQHAFCLDPGEYDVQSEGGELIPCDAQDIAIALRGEARGGFGRSLLIRDEVAKVEVLLLFKLRGWSSFLPEPLCAAGGREDEVGGGSDQKERAEEQKESQNAASSSLCTVSSTTRQIRESKPGCWGSPPRDPRRR